MSFEITLMGVLGGAVLLSGAAFGQSGDDRIFPYPTETQDLANGLRVIVIRTGLPDIISLQIPVQVGSRNEVEPGKSGFAHFFEHMMFRGTKQFPADQYNEILKNAGADQNAYTTDDYTNYHTTFAKEDLETVLMLEADRFQHLDYAVDAFKTEARAVLGEYNKNYSDPVEKLIEVQRDEAFRAHTYKHTTMGFIADIENMPNLFDYSRMFFDRFYRPERTTIILSGDVPENAFELVEKHWSSWKPGAHKDEIPVEPPPAGPITKHISWDSPTLPWVAVAYRGPATSDTAKEMPALDVLAALAFSESSPLYQKLVVREQIVDALFPDFPHQVDPYLLTVLARVKDPADARRVEREIIETLESYRTALADAERLREIKSHLKYSFASGLTDSESIAEAVVAWVARTRDVDAVNRVYRVFDSITAEDVRAAAQRYFVDEGRIVVTLAHGMLPTEPPPTPVDVVLVKTESPLLNFRLLFHVGSIHDGETPGLAMLTAAMVTDAGSTEMSYETIQKALFPMAARFHAQVDKESTVFVGGVHRDHLRAYLQIILAQLMRPAFDTADFARVKSDLINEIRVGLRGNNDEETGKEVLHAMLHDGSYEHPVRGLVAAIEAMSLDDVRAFHRAYYTRANLVLGAAGAIDEAFGEALSKSLDDLPAGPIAPRPEPAARSNVRGVEVRIIEKETRSTAISFGFPIEVTRSHPDFPALWLARSYLGEHRSSNGVLFQKLREVRGLNYGNYAYIEWFPGGMYSFQPPPNLVRSRQIFEIWIRPTTPENGVFALRAALFEFDRLVAEGIPEDAFEATRNFLLKYATLLVKSQDARLGYAMDQRAYGLPEFGEFITSALQSLTAAEVNAVVRRHLKRDRLAIAIVTRDGKALADALIAGTPTPITYDTAQPPEIMAEDRIIAGYPLEIRREFVSIIPVDELFER